jgi:hypothetical protein
MTCSLQFRDQSVVTQTRTRHRKRLSWVGSQPGPIFKEMHGTLAGFAPWGSSKAPGLLSAPTLAWRPPHRVASSCRLATQAIEFFGKLIELPFNVCPAAPRRRSQRGDDPGRP